MNENLNMEGYVVITDSNDFISISETDQSTSHLTYEDINNDCMIGPFKTEINCDKCGGEFIYTGQVFTSIPPQYPYKCKNCGQKLIFRTDGTYYLW